jgi:AcrR family transcriptional regulator
MLAPLQRSNGTPDVNGSNTARRQQVIDAAAAAFAKLGYHGASTRAIADILGIKVASLYFHIQSKDEALEEICTLGAQRAYSYLERALKEADDLAGRIRLFFHYLRDDWLVHADYVRVSIHESRYLSTAAKGRLDKFTGAFRKRLDQMFDEAATRGELEGAITSRQARFLLIATMRSSSDLYAGGNIRDFDEILKGWVEAIIRGLTLKTPVLEHRTAGKSISRGFASPA